MLGQAAICIATSRLRSRSWEDITGRRNRFRSQLQKHAHRGTGCGCKLPIEASAACDPPSSRRWRFPFLTATLRSPWSCRHWLLGGAFLQSSFLAPVLSRSSLTSLLKISAMGRKGRREKGMRAEFGDGEEGRAGWTPPGPPGPTRLRWPVDRLSRRGRPSFDRRGEANRSTSLERSATASSLQESARREIRDRSWCPASTPGGYRACGIPEPRLEFAALVDEDHHIGQGGGAIS